MCWASRLENLPQNCPAKRGEATGCHAEMQRSSKIEPVSSSGDFHNRSEWRCMNQTLEYPYLSHAEPTSTRGKLPWGRDRRLCRRDRHAFLRSDRCVIFKQNIRRRRNWRRTRAACPDAKSRFPYEAPWRLFPMANKMFIDAAHPEETRVVVMRGNRVEEFDFESATRRQLRGNIYLAKVTRVEPSLAGRFRRLRRQPARIPRLQRDPP